MKRNQIENKSVRLWLEDDGVWRLKIKAGAGITIEDIHEIARLTEKFRANAAPFLSDIRNIKSVTHEARKLFSDRDSEITKSIKANAILVSSPISRVIGNFFLGLNKPSFPAKVFTSEEKAVRWLRGFIK